MLRDLTKREIRFCEEYIATGFNGTEAAIRAGYSKKTAASIASENLRKPKIKRYIEARTKAVQEQIEVSQEMIMSELKTIGFSKITDYLSIDEKEVRRKVRGKLTTLKFKAVDLFTTDSMKEEHIPAIASIKQGKEGIELKLHDKVRALELMGKHRGMFKEAETPLQLNVTIE